MKKVAHVARNIALLHDMTNSPDVLNKDMSVRGDLAFEPMAEVILTLAEPKYEMATVEPEVVGGQPRRLIVKDLEFETVRFCVHEHDLKQLVLSLASIAKELAALNADKGGAPQEPKSVIATT